MSTRKSCARPLASFGSVLALIGPLAGLLIGSYKMASPVSRHLTDAWCGTPRTLTVFGQLISRLSLWLRCEAASLGSLNALGAAHGATTSPAANRKKTAARAATRPLAATADA